jgi:transposase
LPNVLEVIVKELEGYGEAIEGLVVESTYNWYWLVDGLMAAGYRVHLANTAAIQQYEGLKYSDDEDDARWLAHLLRLGVLPEGYIYPREERAVRDLVRKRMQLVQQRTAHVLSVQNLVARHTGGAISANRVKALKAEEVDRLIPDPLVALAVNSNLGMMHCLDERIEVLEGEVKAHVRSNPALRRLKTVAGVGDILGMTILLETGDIRRFAKVGCYASYCRCVGSQWRTNGKRKGQGNTKNGNKYLAWAFIEAANYAVRYYPRVRRFHQRKRAKTNAIVATKAVAHKLARAAYHVLRDEVAFDLDKAFA